MWNLGLLGASLDAFSFELIATTVLPSAQSSVVFDVSSFASTYKHLQIRAVMTTTTNSNAPYLRMNGDTGSKYSWHSLVGNSSFVASQNVVSQPWINVGGAWWGIPTGTAPSVSIIDILDFSSTTKNKTIRALSGQAIASANSVALFSGAWQNTSAITSLTIPLSGATQFSAGSRFSIYGIRG